MMCRRRGTRRHERAAFADPTERLLLPLVIAVEAAKLWHEPCEQENDDSDGDGTHDDPAHLPTLPLLLLLGVLQSRTLVACPRSSNPPQHLEQQAAHRRIVPEPVSPGSASWAADIDAGLDRR